MRAGIGFRVRTGYASAIALSGTRNYTRRELTAWLEDAGFASVAVRRNERSPWRLLYLAQA